MRVAWALLVAAAFVACGVRGPPRPPVETPTVGAFDEAGPDAGAPVAEPGCVQVCPDEEPDAGAR